MKKLLCLFYICFVSITAFAQSNDALVKKLLEKQIITEEEAADLLTDSNAPSNTTSTKIEKITDIFNNRYLKIGGYTQFLFSYNSQNQIKNELSIRHAFINLSGSPLDNLSYFVMYNLKGSTLIDGYVTWTPYKAIGAKIGQMKVPLGIENNMSLAKLEFIQNTLMMEYFLEESTM